ncbi:MAG: DUF2442 domain-containing protein [Phoenicibacter congonensis]|uniref:DUF2442 domain-containing protein n=1 Tax=Phoenicibacter congonensis TaxID=1944646 RepID=A0AA43RLW7_9ACTN|nr:DUF2442 domain-containing protein [Phoenicibacter congonensis]
MKIKSAYALNDSVVRFTDEQDRVYDFSMQAWLESPGSWLSQLKDPDYFKLVRVSEDRDTIEWPNGQDVAPHELEDYSVEVDWRLKTQPSRLGIIRPRYNLEACFGNAENLNLTQESQ